MSIAARLKGFLDEQQIKYTLLAHSPAYTAQEAAATLHVPGKELAKTVVVKAEGKLALAVLPASYRVNTKLLAEAAGVKKVELATENEFSATFPDCELGAMPPFGNLYDLPVYVDEALTQDEEIVFHAGTHRDAIRMRFLDFARLVAPRTARFAERR